MVAFKSHNGPIMALVSVLIKLANDGTVSGSGSGPLLAIHYVSLNQEITENFRVFCCVFHKIKYNNSIALISLFRGIFNY